jgi:hypothetical protein
MDHIFRIITVVIRGCQTYMYLTVTFQLCSSAQPAAYVAAVTWLSKKVVVPMETPPFYQLYYSYSIYKRGEDAPQSILTSD